MTSDTNIPSDPTRLPYRLGVGIMLINIEGKVLVARRCDSTSDTWQMPQGGIERNESPQQAAFRELREEIGTDQGEIIAESNDWLQYDYPPELIHAIAKGRCRGQRQKWFLMRFLGHDNDINLDTAKPEFCRWHWAELESLPDLVFPLKRQLYRDLVHEFGPLVGTARSL